MIKKYQLLCLILILVSVFTTQAQKKSYITEKEKVREHTNDITQNAELVADFGTGNNQIRNVQLKGVMVEEAIFENPSVIKDEVEGNDALTVAENIAINSDEAVRINASLKNRTKVGGVSGDVDIYELFFEEGKHYALKIQKTGEEPFQFSARIFYGDDSTKLLTSFVDSDIFLFSENDIKGKVKLAIYSSYSFVSQYRLNDPENIHRVDGEFDYTIAVREIPGTYIDKDLYKIALQKGDVFGLAGESELPLDQIALTNVETGSFIGIEDNKYAIEFVAENPLPREGDYGFHYVIPEDGIYMLSVDGKIGGYTMELGVSRSGVEENANADRQVIFLNMSGATISPNVFYKKVFEDPDDAVERALSNLASFMPKWGLDEETQLRSLSKKIKHDLTRKLRSEVSRKNINPDFGITILSDLGSPKRRDKIVRYLNHKNIPYSQVIIGGTRIELQRFVLGDATITDVGNFDLSDYGVVLLDILSEEFTESTQSINNIPLAEGVEKIDLVADVIASIAAHEIGHLLGSFHTDETNDTLSIMDLGDGIASYVGVLEGDAYGDKENVKVSFIKDGYSERENFLIGSNETDANTAFGLTVSKKYANKGEDGLITFINNLDDSHTSSVFPSISSYPNPQSITQTSIVTVDLEVDSFLKVSLFDLQGRKISELFTGDIKAGQPMELAVDPKQYNLKSGAYLVKIFSSAGQKVHKLIIK